MEHYKIASKAKRAALGALALVVREPKAQVGIGALLLALGLYMSASSAPMYTLMALGGGVGLGIGFVQLRRRKRNRNTLRPKHIVGLIGAGAVFAAAGVVNMLEASPALAYLALIGGGSAGMGMIRLRTRRRRALTDGTGGQTTI